VLDGLLQQLLQVAGTGLGGRQLGTVLREEQVQVLVEPTDGVGELLDGRACDQLASQALDRRGEQLADEGEIGAAPLLRVVLAGYHAEQREELALVVAHRPHVHRQVPREEPHLTGAVGVGPGREECVIDDIHQVRAGRGLGRPEELPGGPEHCDTGGPGQERADQPDIWIEAITGLAGNVLAERKRTHGSEHLCASAACGPCSSWRIRAPGRPDPAKY
jgi:hypothetical protein